MAPNRLIEDLSARHNLPAMASDAEPPDTLDITMGELDEEDNLLASPLCFSDTHRAPPHYPVPGSSICAIQLAT
ncbi:hypothetical protein SCP_1702300 [Sparassis crispa]|uniref:Uncharacterized protein n=1 Tax=Sparassis crispa TaxID=139825 RepID=A0A401H662_9APHY|nr:hypothetical protein SCP_1702300 [Sparassis crispa]GBE89904.1 hypothetical protein SCP_1702300 [Sparassis crispa]